nr:response regulator transcription factor [Acanthopleuribacter pedis]
MIVEDNVETARNICLYMEHHGFSCQVTASGAAAVALAKQMPFDLVILDVMLPDLDGFSVCEQIRAQSDMPIIMLTARAESGDLVEGLQRGADEYVKKPYSNKELVARVKAHLRRRQPAATARRIGPFEIDDAAFSARCLDQSLRLTRTEFRLLAAMVRAPERVFSRDQLCRLGLEDPAASGDRGIDVHIHNLRRKITHAGLVNHGITAVYGLGYKWVPS